MSDAKEWAERLARRRQEKEQPKPKPPPSGGFSVELADAYLPQAMTVAAAALANGHGLYRQEGRIVRVVKDTGKTHDGQPVAVLRIRTVDADYLQVLLTRAVQFLKWSKGRKEWMPCNCPSGVAKAYLKGGGEWRMPWLRGLSQVPILRSNGTLHDTPGYDPVSALYYDPGDLVVPTIPAQPTRDDALAALALLKGLLVEVTFADEASRSVVLSGMITPVVRDLMETAPLHALSAPAPGAGKSYLNDVMAMIATGERAPVTEYTFQEDENRKRLDANLLMGDTMIFLDNIDHKLSGSRLNQMLTQPRLRVRPLGVSELQTVANTATMYANGKNLEYFGDITRRVVQADLLVEQERPEERQYDHDPLAMIRAERGRYVAAALTVVQVWVRTGEKAKLVLGSFEDWSRIVRGALLWLGEPDPVETMEKVRGADGRIAALRNMADAWQWEFAGRWMRASEVTKLVDSDRMQHGAVFEAMQSVRVSQDAAGKLSTESLGRWLMKNRNTPIRLEDGTLRRFECDEKARNKWRLAPVDGTPVVDLTGRGPTGAPKYDPGEPVPF